MRLALLCWQTAADGRRRPLALLGLRVSLAAAISTHFYTVFVFLCLALGELARIVSRRRWDPAIWAAFAAGALPLLLFRPIIVAARSRSARFLEPAQPDEVLRLLLLAHFHRGHLSAARLRPRLGQSGAGRAPAPARDRPTATDAISAMPLHEFVAFVAFTLIPIFVRGAGD